MTEYSVQEQEAYDAGLKDGASKSIQKTCGMLANIDEIFQRNQDESLEDWRDNCVNVVRSMFH